MEGKIAVSVFFAVLIVIFAYYIFVLQPQSFTNPIDPNNEYKDYQVLESVGTSSYTIIGQIEEISNGELKIKTSERIVTIKKPEAIEYSSLVPRITLDENQLQQNDYVRATVDVSKSTNEIVALTTVFIGRIKEGELSIPFKAVVD